MNECESLEHMVKDCPRRHDMKPPMSLCVIEYMSPSKIRLTTLAAGTNLGICGIMPSDLSEDFFLKEGSF